METLQRTANRGSISTGFDISNSVKFEDANDEYFTRTNASGTNDKTFTVSFWFKRTKLGGVQELWDGGVFSEATRIGFGLSSDELWLDIGKSSRYRSSTTQQFRDTSAWYHIVWKVDTTQSTEADRFRVYVNGAEITDWASRQYPTQNFETSVASGLLARIGSYDSTYHGSSGYMAEFNYLDGLAVAPTEFGEYDDDTGTWKPKAYTGSYPGQSAYLDFKDGSNLGANAKGDDTDWTEVNLTAVDQATDTPTNNFAIGNILTGTGGYFVITEGATKAVLSTAGPGNNIGGVSLVSTLAPSSGKWYFEAQNTNSGDVYLYLGVSDTGGIGYTDGKTFGGSGSNPSVGWRGGGAQDGKVYINNSATGTADTWETEVVGVALDLDNGKIYFHKSGTYINSGDPASGTDNGGQYDLPTAVDGQWYLGFSAYNLATWLINFGGYTTMSISSAASDANGYGTFEYAPPSGYYALCTKNLAEYG